jgi:hypothetical protein
VKAQTDKGITTAQAGILRGHSDGIKSVLGC